MVFLVPKVPSIVNKKLIKLVYILNIQLVSTSLST